MTETIDLKEFKHVLCNFAEDISIRSCVGRCMRFVFSIGGTKRTISAKQTETSLDFCDEAGETINHASVSATAKILGVEEHKVASQITAYRTSKKKQ